ncbi:MAG: DUF2029 domain-containing protein [Bacteroidia bacterium]|nr:DUF2029 domain-containing protein [Bacteroidia bacterium]
MAGTAKLKIDDLFENKFKIVDVQKFIYFFLLFNCILLVITFNHPIGDFGNYYYGSRFWREGIDPLKFYQSIHFFNSEIRLYESGVFFENYTPVPPFSLLFYWPFTFLKLSVAKLLFNLLGLFVFCFSLQRLIKTLRVISPAFYFLPVIFLQPLYSNFHHGQAYLLIAALLFEFYIALQNNRKITPGVIIALLFCLKVFPAFIAVLFLFKKDWKAFGWTILFTSAILLLTYLLVGAEVVNYYYQDVFPRLALNDVTAPFSHFNQSFHTFLLNSFVFHPFLNPTPLLNATLIAVIAQVVFYSFVFSLFIKVVLKQDVFASFFISVLVLVLINKYSTVYGLIVLFPFIFFLKNINIKKMALICCLLFIACNVPIHKLSNLPLLLQYTRVWLLIAVFIIIMVEFKTAFDLKYFVACLLIFILPSMAFYNYKSDSVNEFRSKTGVVYDFNVSHDHIDMYTCMGNRDTLERIAFVSNKIDSTTFRKNYPEHLLTNKAIFVNNKDLIFMSDENSGVGMYYLQVIKPTRVE